MEGIGVGDCVGISVGAFVGIIGDGMVVIMLDATFGNFGEDGAANSFGVTV